MLRDIPEGQIYTQYFTMFPINGSPGDQLLPDNIFPADYEVSFIPSTDIPQYGMIEIVFPTTEFN